MTEPRIIYNPVQIAECGGPCEQGAEYCDCGELRIERPDTSMTKQITLEEALQLVSFIEDESGKWRVNDVRGSVLGDVGGNVWGDVGGNIYGNVYDSVGGNIGGSLGGDINGNVWGNVGNVLGDVLGNIRGTVKGDILSDEWQRVETPKQKFKRSIEKTNNPQLLEAFNQLENN